MLFNELRQQVQHFPPDAQRLHGADRLIDIWQTDFNTMLRWAIVPPDTHTNTHTHTHTHTQKHIINYCLTATVWSEEKERCLLSPQIPLIDFHSRLPIMHALCSRAAGEWSTCQLSVGKCLPSVDAARCECSSAWGAIMSRKGVSEKDIFHVLVRLNLRPSA